MVMLQSDVVLQNTLICSFVFTMITETHSHGQGLIRYVSSKYSVLELYIHIDYKDTFSWTGFIWFIMVSTLSALSSSDNSITGLARVKGQGINLGYTKHILESVI